MTIRVACLLCLGTLVIAGCASTATPDQRLINACLADRAADAQLAIKDGANVNAEETTRAPNGTMIGRMPLTAAVAKHDVALIEQLIDAGADVNRSTVDGFTPLSMTVNSRSHDIASVLLKHGAKANATYGPQNGRMTPLFWAAGTHDMDMCIILLANVADPNAVSTAGRVTPIAIAIVGAKEEAAAYKVTKLLIDKGAKTDALDQDDDTLLHYAAIQGFPQIVILLVNCGMQVNKPNKHGVTPLYYAVSANKPQAVEALLRVGADSTAKADTGKTPLDLAMAKGYEECAQLLRGYAKTPTNPQ